MERLGGFTHSPTLEQPIVYSRAVTDPVDSVVTLKLEKKCICVSVLVCYTLRHSQRLF